jgi:hypothetical protein
LIHEVHVKQNILKTGVILELSLSNPFDHDTGVEK